MASDASPRIDRLRTLIDHPRTGDSERAVAQRMLDRILGRTGIRDHSGGPDRGAGHGRVGRHAGLAHIADLIRGDIALARSVFTANTPDGLPAVADPIGNAPPGITLAVETPHDAGIVITIDGVPEHWGWVNDGGIETVTPALRTLADELASVMNAYNRDDAEGGRRFFGRVRVRDTTLVW
ncbi:hypothetical protein [Rhodococcus sp. NPDC003348]